MNKIIYFCVPRTLLLLETLVFPLVGGWWREGGGARVIDCTNRKEDGTLDKKLHTNQFVVLLSIPYIVTPSIDQTKLQSMALLPNFDVYQKCTRCFHSSFTPVWHCQKGILTPAGTWLRTVETCIICYTFCPDLTSFALRTHGGTGGHRGHATPHPTPPHPTPIVPRSKIFNYEYTLVLRK